MLECRGVESKKVKELDQHSDKWRRMYFLRNLVRTLVEIRSALESLQKEPEFKRILAKQPTPKQDEFRRIIKEFNQAHEDIKEIRNSIGGGHVKQKSVQEALDVMSFDQWGFLEVGQILKDAHFKFAGELVAAIWVRGVPEKTRESKIEADLKKIATLFPVLPLMNEIVGMYADERGLFE